MPARARLCCIVVIAAACSRPAPSAAAGRSLYLSNGCASCHGESGKGDGAASARLAVKPSDLRYPNQFRNGASEDAIARTLSQGILGPEAAGPHAQHTHHVLVMPKFDHLSDLERRSIALYITSLRIRGD